MRCVLISYSCITVSVFAGWFAGCQFDNQGIDNNPQAGDAAPTDDGGNQVPDGARLPDAYVDPTREKTLTIVASQVQAPDGGALADFPLLVSLVDEDIAAAARPDGDDIRFFASDGTTELARDIERWDPMTGTLIAWVQIPSLSASVDTSIFIRYAIPEPGPVIATTDVWDARYAAVYHMNSDGQPDDQLLDSTSNGNHGAKVDMSSPVLVEGQIGDGQSFDGGDDFITVDDAVSLDMGGTFTTSLWLAHDKGVVPNNYERILSKKYSYTSLHGWEVSLESGYDNALTARGASLVNPANLNNMPSWRAGGWRHLAVVYNSVNVTAFIDGQYVDNTLIASAADSERPLFIGRYGEGDSHFWGGRMDEIRLAPSALSAEWIATEFNNQSNPDNFYVVGPERSPSL